MRPLDFLRQIRAAEAPSTPGANDPLPGIQPPTRQQPNGFMSMSSVFSAVGLIATGVSQLTFDVWRGDDLVDSELATRPDPLMPLSSFLELTVTSLATLGNAYWLLKRDDRNQVISCTVIDPNLVTVHSKGRWASYQGRDHSLLPGGDMVQLCFLRLPGRIDGLGPIQAARIELEGAMSVRDYGSNFFQTGEQPTGVLKSDQPLTADAADRWRAQWMAQRAKRQVAVLGSGLTYDALVTNPRDAQFIESQNFNTTGIARLFRIPARLFLAVVEGGSETYANMQQEDLSFYRWTLSQYTREIEEALSWLLPGRQRARFNLDAFLRPDTKTRYETHRIGVDGGFLTPNEVRKIERYDPLPDGNALRSPKTTSPEAAKTEEDPRE